MENCRILLVEDRQADIGLIKHQIENVLESYQVNSVNSKNDFVRQLNELNPHLVICSLDAASVDPVSIVRITRIKSRITPVIILYKAMKENLLTECMEAGATNHCSKKQLNRLSQVIASALGNEIWGETAAYAKRNTASANVAGIPTGRETFFTTLFNNIPDIYFQTDMMGDLYDISPSIASYLKYEKSELIGNSVFTLYWDARDRESLIQSLVKHGEMRDFKIRFRTKTGEMKHGSIYARLLYNASGQPDLIVGTIRDTTGAVEAANSLRWNEEMYRSIFDNQDTSILLIDLQEQKIVTANLAATKLYGWSTEEFLKINPRELFNITPHELANLTESVKTTGNLHYETWHKCKNGTTKNVEVTTGKVIIMGKNYLWTAVRDVNSMKTIDQQAQWMTIMAENSPVGLLVANPLGDIEYINQKYSAVTGLSLADVIGKNLWFRYYANNSGNTFTEIWNMVQSGQSWSGECSTTGENGQPAWENVHIVPINNKHGQLIHIVVSNENIDEWHKTMDELTSAKVRAEITDKMKTGFINNISDEIRSPLTGIIGFTEMLQNPDFSDETKMNFMDIVSKSSLNLLNTINSYLDISMILSGKGTIHKKHCTVGTLLEKVKKEMKGVCEAGGITLNIIQPAAPDAIVLNTNPEILHKIFTHLVNNAVKFTQEGSIDVGFRLSKNMPGFFVADTGTGMDSDQVNSINDYFNLADTTAPYDFTGGNIGLSIVHGLVTILEGKIHLESTPGKGSRFYFTLPAGAMATAVVSEKAPPAKIPVKENPVILVAEDNDFNYMYIEAVLNNAGYRVIRAVNGLEAVEICHSNPEVSLVLMDLNMPLMDGREAIRQIKGFLPDLPVIVLTAYVSFTSEEDAFLSGCQEFLKKPINRDDLLISVENTVHNRMN
ncbi:MAG TPA: PAS domain S-box protein [Bacteroidales bacterium]|nr:PAS domain S-box protein [Bacteroidales bacterium]